MNHFYSRKTLVLLLFSLIFPLSVSAKIVTPSQALRVANSFFSQTKVMQAGSVDLTLSWTSSDISDKASPSSVEDPAFYVFVPKNSKGFVIVSGDDAIVPIIGYSFENPAPSADDVPVNMKEWLGIITEAVQDLRSHNISSPLEVQKRWANPRPSAAVKELETALWGQGSPFNDQCPTYKGEKCLTGCVITAAAEVLQYHKHPAESHGVTEPYRSERDDAVIDMPERNLNHPIHWEDMLPNYHGSTSQAQKDAVSQLMADLGSAMQVKYGTSATSSSTSNLPHVLYEYYNYSPSACMISRADYSDEQWKEYIMEDIDNDCPIIYRATNETSNAGHSFILDGYSDGNEYHFNWGWEGKGNGYYALDMMNPRSDRNYCRKQKCLKGLKPDDGAPMEIIRWIKLYRGLKSSTDEIEQGKSFKVNDLALLNDGDFAYSGDIAIVMTDADGNVKETLTQWNVPSLSPHYYKTYDYVTLTVKSPIKSGYRIRCLYRAENSEEWKDVRSYNAPDPWEIVIKVPDQTIEQSTSFFYDNESEKVTVEFAAGVVPTFLCDGTEYTSGVTVSTNSIIIDVSGLDPEKMYTVHLVKGEETKDINLNVKSL